MTKAQERVIESIKREFEEMAKQYHRDGEVKWIKVEDHDSFVSVSGCVGNRGDEGTYSAILCREHVHLFIGKRGRVTYPIWKKKQKKQITRPRGIKCLWSIAYEQEEADRY